MARFFRTLVVTAFSALALTGAAQAAGGNYVFDGGTPKQQAAVKNALDASAFNWSVIPAEITIHIKRGATTEAAPGEIWVDAKLLTSGKFAWGAIQHEYAHQVDFFLLGKTHRAELMQKLGGRAWYQAAGVAHADSAAERFASTLAWAYWPTKENAMRPTSKTSESAAMAPAAFRSLLAQLSIAA